MEKVETLNELSKVRDKLRCLTILTHALFVEDHVGWSAVEENGQAVHALAIDIEDTVRDLIESKEEV